MIGQSSGLSHKKSCGLAGFTPPSVLSGMQPMNAHEGCVACGCPDRSGQSPRRVARDPSQMGLVTLSHWLGRAWTRAMSGLHTSRHFFLTPPPPPPPTRTPSSSIDPWRIPSSKGEHMRTPGSIHRRIHLALVAPPFPPWGFPKLCGGYVGL